MIKRLLPFIVFAAAVARLSAQVPDLSKLSTTKDFLGYASEISMPAPAGQAVGPSSYLASAVPAAPPQLPGKFTIKERIISFTDTFDLVAGGEKFGVITQKIISLTRSFKYKDAQGNLVAEARSRIFSWGTHVDVTDNLGSPIGGFKEQVFKSFFKVYTAYSILDSQGRQVALSEKVDWLGTKVVISDLQGRKVAALERPWINFFSDHWDVQVFQPEVVDSRVMVMIAAYKTSVDNARRREQSDQESRQRRSQD